MKYSAYYTVYDKIISMNEITEFQFLYSNYSLSDLSLSLLDNITQELIEQTIENVTNIYNEGFNLFRENIFKDFQKDYVLNYLEFELNSTANKYNKDQTAGSNYLINHLNTSTKEVIENIVNLFFEKANEVYNINDITNSFEQAQNKSMEKYSFKNNFDDFSSLIIKDIINFSEMSILRYSEEQNEFKSIIKIIFEDKFKEYVNNYINNIGYDYLIQIINEDYEMNIADSFRFFNTNIKDIYNFMNVLIDTSELKALGYELIVGIINNFPYVRGKIMEIIPDKITKIIYPKIEIFKSEIQTKITKVYISYITSEKVLNYLSSEYSSNVYNLIPKSYSDSFYAILEDDFNSLISDSIVNIKDLYNTNITENLNKFNETFYGYEKLIKDKIWGVVPLKLDYEWFSLNKKIKETDSKVNEYDIEILFNTNIDTEEKIDEFFNSQLVYYLQSIIVGYNNQVKIGQDNLKYNFDNFDFNLSYDNVKNELKSINFEENITSIKYNIEKTINNINTIEIISGLSEKLEEYSENIEFTGFTSSNNRRLEEQYSNEPFNVTYIEDGIKILKDKYTNFQKEILNDNTFGTIANQKYSFNNYFTESALHLTDYFYSYQSLISIYTNSSDIENLFNKMNNAAKEIRTLYIEFSNSHSKLIDNTIDTVRKQVLVLWEKTRENINKYIYTSLNKIFAEKFKSINNIPLQYFYSREIPNIGTITLNNEKGEKIISVNVTLQSVDSNANYELNKSNLYDFSLIMNAGSAIYMSLESTIGDFYQATTEGYLASGDIGVKTDYILHDQSVEIDAYYTQNNTQYFNILKQYNFNTNNWDVLLNNTEENIVKDNIHMKKTYRKRW